MDIFGKLWDWLNGKKSIIGLVAALATLVVGFLTGAHDAIAAVYPALPLVGKLLAVISAASTVTGLLHKLAKLVGAE